MTTSDDRSPTPLTEHELGTIVGGNKLIDGLSQKAHDAYRGAVNWGLGAYVGTQSSGELYRGKASWGAWWAHTKAVHDALDETGQTVELMPLIKSALGSAFSRGH